MQKQRIVEVENVEDSIVSFPAPRARPDLRLANDSDAEAFGSVVGPARRLQDDLAQALTAAPGWSVRRTVFAGIVFHAIVLGSLALAASNLIPQLTR